MATYFILFLFSKHKNRTIIHTAYSFSKYLQGATNHIIEYFGPGVSNLSCTGMATICNMGAEVGATTSLFPYSEAMGAYLRSTGRSELSKEVEAAARLGYLERDAGASYDKVIEIDLSSIEPHINGPFTPDAATPISQFKHLVKEKGWKDVLATGLIGSCTNSSYEDMTRVVSITKQAKKGGIERKAELLVTPGSEQIRATMERDGIIGDVSVCVYVCALINYLHLLIFSSKELEPPSSPTHADLASANGNAPIQPKIRKTPSFLALTATLNHETMAHHTR